MQVIPYMVAFVMATLLIILVSTKSLLPVKFQFTGFLLNLSSSDVIQTSLFPKTKSVDIPCMSECLLNMHCKAIGICYEEDENICTLYSRYSNRIGNVEKGPCEHLEKVLDCQNPASNYRIEACQYEEATSDIPETTTVPIITTEVLPCVDCDCTINTNIDAKCNEVIAGIQISGLCTCRNGKWWMVIQRRFDGSMNFNRSWDDYRMGFGSVMSEFWLGNDAIHTLTMNGHSRLKIELEDEYGDSAYAKYNTFLVHDSASQYRLEVYDFSGDAGDCFNNCFLQRLCHNGILFTTYDRDNDKSYNRNCAVVYNGGWWYNSCLNCKLNGKYGYDGSGYQGIVWLKWKGSEPLKKTQIMIR